MPSLLDSLQVHIQALPGHAGIAALNLSTGERVAINDCEHFPTASMIKTMVLFELFRQQAEGKTSLTERLPLKNSDRTLGSGVLMEMDEGANLTLRDLGVLMMSISDNTATNMLIERLGLEPINVAIRSAGMMNTALNNPIDWNKISASQEALGVTTPADYVHFFARLSRHELLPPDATAAMLKIMRNHKYIEPIRKYLPYSPYCEEFGARQDIWIASKGGALDGTRCAGGIV